MLFIASIAGSSPIILNFYIHCNMIGPLTDWKNILDRKWATEVLKFNTNSSHVPKAFYLATCNALHVRKQGKMVKYIKTKWDYIEIF